MGGPEIVFNSRVSRRPNARMAENAMLFEKADVINSNHRIEYPSWPSTVRQTNDHIALYICLTCVLGLLELIR